MENKAKARFVQGNGDHVEYIAEGPNLLTPRSWPKEIAESVAQAWNLGFAHAKEATKDLEAKLKIETERRIIMDKVSHDVARELDELKPKLKEAKRQIQARMEWARNMRHSYEVELDKTKSWSKQLEESISRADARSEELLEGVKNLRRYAAHNRDCCMEIYGAPDCDCGLEVAMKKTAKLVEGK